MRWVLISQKPVPANQRIGDFPLLCIAVGEKARSFEAEPVWLQSLSRQIHQFRKLRPMAAGT